MAVWWYVIRASGLVAWALLTMSVVWGLMLSTKLFGRKPAPVWLLDLHRFLGGATVVFTLVHVVGILADSFVNFDLAGVLVPFASTWNPLAVAFGIVAMYLLLAVQVTSMLRRHLSKRVWRRVHYASFPLFVSATIHGVSAGSDAGSTVAIFALLVALGIVGLLVAVRIGRARMPAEPSRVPASARPATGRARMPSEPADVPASARPPMVSSASRVPSPPPRRSHAQSSLTTSGAHRSV